MCNDDLLCLKIYLGTIHKTCRPSVFQQEAYSGHKRVHGLKYQSTVIPSGLIANLHGPEPGRRNDSFMLARSNLLQRLEEHLNAPDLYIYGDSGYPLKRHLITPYIGSNLTDEQREFNTTMSKLRICVEWEFGELFEQFAFLRYKFNQKIFLQPLKKYVCFHNFEKLSNMLIWIPNINLFQYFPTSIRKLFA